MSEAERLNIALHGLFGADVCDTGCTHVIAGTWTALGIANVLARVVDGSGPQEHK